MVRPLKVLFLSAEATPLAKVGGLGDVGGELPRALRARGLDVRSVLPRYPSIPAGREGVVTDVEVASASRLLAGRLLERETDDGVVWLIDGPPVAAEGGIYSDGEPEAEKFIFWSLGALDACKRIGWKPDVVHAHDWHAAAAVAGLWQLRRDDPFWAGTASVLTIHNLGYRGQAGEAAWERHGLPPAPGRDVPEEARLHPLAVGLATADALTTVSPTYAREIQSEELGFGLDGVLRRRRGVLTGILNGIDPQVWNPRTDASLAARFHSGSLERRPLNRHALLADLRLDDRGRIPLLAYVGRMEHQKGVDLLIHALARVLDIPWQAVILGTGQPEVESMAETFARGHSGRVRFLRRFDPEVARRIYGAADMILVPSRYEPCGLVQMIGMRYGCVPVVRATGGLRDTVREGRGGTGFVFDQPNADGLAQALHRALATFADDPRWSSIQRRAARREFSWKAPAGRYVEVYRRALRRLGTRTG